MIYDTWDILEKFKGELNNRTPLEYLSSLKISVEQFQAKLDALHHSDPTLDEIKECILSGQQVYKSIYQFLEVALSLRSYDTTKDEYRNWLEEINRISGEFNGCQTTLLSLLLALSEESFAALLAEKEIEPFAFLVRKWRSQAGRMKPEVEKAIQEMEATGLHAWGDLYTTISSRIRFQIKDGGEEKNVSLGEFSTIVHYGEDRSQRLQYFEQFQQKWAQEADLCAAALNNIAGERIKRSKMKGQASFLEESLQQNRIQEQTVQVMWQALARHKQPFIDYLKRKKKLYQTDQLSWSDQLAPVPRNNERSSMKLSFEQAIQFIGQGLEPFDPKLSEFVHLTAQNKWIDAKVREHKAVGAFCASFPEWKEPRVMLSFHHDLESTGVLAHELGHAYHYHLLYDFPMYIQDIPPTVAEISSTLTETIVMREAVARATSLQEKIRLLDYQIIKDIGTVLNIYVRYLFEYQFYTEREHGSVSVERLNELMLQAQKEAFDDVFDSYHPTFWASLRHFYMTRMPFVHYPYTVAHLLSTGIYAQIKDQEKRGELLRNILTDSSSLTIEEIGSKHLGVQLQEEFFWQKALDVLYENIHLFMELTASDK